MQCLNYLSLIPLIVAFNIILGMSGCGDPGMSIGLIEANNIALRIGIVPAFTGTRCQGCVLLETSKLLADSDIDRINTTDLVVGTKIHSMLPIAILDQPSVVDKSTVSTRGVVGMDIFEIDLRNLKIDDHKHYYVLGMRENCVYIRVIVDRYLL